MIYISKNKGLLYAARGEGSWFKRLEFTPHKLALSFSEYIIASTKKLYDFKMLLKRVKGGIIKKLFHALFFLSF